MTIPVTGSQYQYTFYYDQVGTPVNVSFFCDQLAVVNDDGSVTLYNVSPDLYTPYVISYIRPTFDFFTMTAFVNNLVNLLVSANDLSWWSWGLFDLTLFDAGENTQYVLETAANAPHYVTQQCANDPAGLTFRCQADIAPHGRDWVKIRCMDGAAVNGAYVNFDVTNGVWGTNAGQGTGAFVGVPEAVLMGEGYWRIQFDFSGSVDGFHIIYISSCDVDNNPSHPGDITKGLAIRNAAVYQLT